MRSSCRERAISSTGDQQHANAIQLEAQRAKKPLPELAENWDDALGEAASYLKYERGLSQQTCCDYGGRRGVLRL